MILNETEKQSALWQKITQEVNARLVVMREKNDTALNMEDTASLRGSIKFAKEVLGWAETKPKFE